jgi:hypothetical protein
MLLSQSIESRGRNGDFWYRQGMWMTGAFFLELRRFLLRLKPPRPMRLVSKPGLKKNFRLGYNNTDASIFVAGA